jgi:hypothetical protein
MPYRFSTCEKCDAKFVVKKLRKPFIGYFKMKPVYHWQYVHEGCGHVHTVRFWCEHSNDLYDRVQSINFSLIVTSDVDKVERLQEELSKAKEELDMVNDEVKKGLIKIRPVQLSD